MTKDTETETETEYETGVICETPSTQGGIISTVNEKRQELADYKTNKIKIGEKRQNMTKTRRCIEQNIIDCTENIKEHQLGAIIDADEITLIQINEEKERRKEYYNELNDIEEYEQTINELSEYNENKIKSLTKELRMMEANALKHSAKSGLDHKLEVLLYAAAEYGVALCVKNGTPITLIDGDIFGNTINKHRGGESNRFSEAIERAMQNLEDIAGFEEAS